MVFPEWGAACIGLVLGWAMAPQDVGTIRIISVKILETFPLLFYLFFRFGLFSVAAFFLCVFLSSAIHIIWFRQLRAKWDLARTR